MKKIMLTAALFLLGASAFCQTEEKNGTIYIKHPYIDMVMNANKDYANGDFSTITKYYADSAKWWASGMGDFIPLAEAVKMWKSDFEKFDDIKQVQFGYPDFLSYKKDNSMVVQSWWKWSGKSKKTGEMVETLMVMFDDFNKDGKIIREYIFGDFSKLQ
ncbi:MAG: nuclear transport factor 2 family protein [Ginsengibacter sp.]